MFSGKSEELIRRVTRYQIARVPIQTFKPRLDVRYADSEVVSHSSLKVEAIPVETSSELLHRVDDSTRVIGIDEGQFFDDGLIDVVEQLASAEKQVIVAGLDTDYLRRPSSPFPPFATAPSTSPRCLRSVTNAAGRACTPSGSCIRRNS